MFDKHFPVLRLYSLLLIFIYSSNNKNIFSILISSEAINSLYLYFL